MNQSDDIFNELRTISPLLADHERINVFSVPEGYFSNLSERVAAYTLLNKDEEINFGKTETMRVPAGYFDSLSDRILSKIKNQELEKPDEPELEELSPLLFSLKNKNVFTVPQGYFENISDTVLDKVNQKPAKVVSISKARSFWKYAAAAVVTGAIAVSSIQIFNNSPEMKKNNSVVTESSGLPDYIQSSFQYKTPEQVQAGIASLSDDAIVNYLEKSGSMIDNETLTNVSDAGSKDLPAETDYLTDDNTLNNYLDAIDYSNAGKKSK